MRGAWRLWIGGRLFSFLDQILRLSGFLLGGTNGYQDMTC
jgi:hypothetical protein